MGATNGIGMLNVFRSHVFFRFWGSGLKLKAKTNQNHSMQGTAAESHVPRSRVRPDHTCFQEGRPIMKKRLPPASSFSMAKEMSQWNIVDVDGMSL